MGFDGGNRNIDELNSCETPDDVTLVVMKRVHRPVDLILT